MLFDHGLGFVDGKEVEVSEVDAEGGLFYHIDSDGDRVELEVSILTSIVDAEENLVDLRVHCRGHGRSAIHGDRVLRGSRSRRWKRRR